MHFTGRLWRAVVSTLWMLVLLSGCSGHEEASDAPEAAPTEATVRFFQKPFRGSILNSAPFDHDLPLALQGDSNNYMLTWWGGRINGIWSGHNGHDWSMLEGTPILAVADGEVVYADFEPPFLCGSVGKETSALVVRLRHVAPNGERFDSQYVHLSRIDVESGQTVQAGQHIGLSGRTGCTNGPHLHFEVFRLTHTNNGQPTRIDPFGWEGPGVDPWAQHPEGAQSVLLWKEGQAPEGGKRIDEVWGPGTLER